MQQVRPHPITGAPMAPLGYTKRGMPIWPVSGGAPDGDEGSGTGTPPPAAGTNPPPAAGTVSQEAVDALVKDRVARARETERAKFADYDDVKAKAARLDALEAENATTLDRERAKAKGEGAAEVMAKANTRLVAAEVRAQAAGLKFRDPHDALAHLTVTGALGQVKVSEDGDVDANAVKAALENLAKDKAYLLETTEPPPPPPPGAAGVGTGSAGTKRETTPGMGTLRNAYANSTTK